jgi:protein-S-isoprenylcysteine O-methyltransferase Ste14
VLLIFSAYLVIAGSVLMKKRGKPKELGDDATLYKFENTSELVDTGIFKFIRHPLYSSLLFLTWGIYFKGPSGFLLIVSFLSTTFLFITAKVEEKECIKRFGVKYNEYMKRSRMFIPYII